MKYDGLDYYEYVLLYTEYLIMIIENNECVLREHIGK